MPLPCTVANVIDHLVATRGHVHVMEVVALIPFGLACFTLDGNLKFTASFGVCYFSLSRQIPPCIKISRFGGARRYQFSLT